MQIDEWQNFPMGPTLRAFLKLDPQEVQDNPTQEAREEFDEILCLEFEEKEAENFDEYFALLEELVLMRLPKSADELLQKNPHYWNPNDFLLRIHAGSAQMLLGKTDQAKEHFVAAHELVPEEVSPYTNLAMLFFDEKNYKTAIEWLKRGLKVAKNHRNLWELLGAIYFETQEQEGLSNLTAFAEDLGSWAGKVLSFHYRFENDPQLITPELQKIYVDGERDTEFLIEYTANLGAVQDYAAIPPIIHEVDPDLLNWQLSLHAAQAFYGLHDEKQADGYVRKAMADPKMPEQARKYADELINPPGEANV